MGSALVTGSTDGIGRQIAMDLATMGYLVLVHGRDAARVDAVATDIIAAGGTAEPLVANFERLPDVTNAAYAVADRLADSGLDVLINNAGTFAPERGETDDGHEITWQVNHLAPSLLTDLLLDTAAQARGRVVFVSAALHAHATLDLDDAEFVARPYNAMAAYGQSKLAAALMTRETARRLGPDAPVTVNAADPGVVGTKLLHAAAGISGKDPLTTGSHASVAVATDESMAGVTGSYVEKGVIKPFRGRAKDDALASRLYEDTCAVLGVPGLPDPAGP